MKTEDRFPYRGRKLLDSAKMGMHSQWGSIKGSREALRTSSKEEI